MAAMSQSIEEIIAGIDRLRDEAKEFLNVRADDGLPSEKLKAWTRRAYDQLKSWGFGTEAEQGFGSTSMTHMYSGVAVRAKGRDEKLQALRDDLATHPEHYSLKLSQAVTPRIVYTTARHNKIFLGHGRNSLWARVQIYLKDELHLNVEAWESESRTGLHAIDVLKPILNSCTFAVIIATGEDFTASGEVRARQNVVHEIGLFQGRIGFEKVALLQQRGIEEFSNLAGLQVILFSDAHIEATFYELGRMLKREGIVS
jgi:predicted nucleotide-binding protein